MEMRTNNPERRWNNLVRKSPEREHFSMPEVLLIGRDQHARMYTDDVLRRGGFHVRAIAPWEADRVLHDGIDSFSLVIFSNTLYPQDIADIGSRMRRHSPNIKLLLILGPDSTPASASLFDATLEGLDGPTALIRAARQLAESLGGATGMSA